MSETRPETAHPTLYHRLRPMSGRNPDEPHRAATPLELLFDLTFVIAFGQAGDQASHLLAEGHYAAALGGFAFAMFAICWAWTNFTWFASAYDTDDWFFRVTTMVQMVGVLVLALGLPAMFTSLDHGALFDNNVMVAGYVVMRVALVIQWLRAARQDPARRDAALINAVFVTAAQIGWVLLLALRQAPPAVFLLALVITVALDVSGPIAAERLSKRGTPWHAHHIAERYGLLVIIALGEGIFGTIASVSAIVQNEGWSAEAILIIVAGTGLTFAMWWLYFIVPSGPVLHKHRERSFVWGYSHIVIFASIAATGAGLHVAAYVLEHESHIGPVMAVLAVAAPAFIYAVAILAISVYLLRSVSGFYYVILIWTAAVLGFALILAGSGVSLGVCLLVVTAAPVGTVVSYETFGYRSKLAALERALK